MKLLIGFSEKEYPNVKMFENLGDCDFSRYDRDYLLNNIEQYDILVPHLFLEIDNDVIAAAKNLKIVATPSTGKDHIDINALEKEGIHLISLNDDQSFIGEITSTAEMSWLLILSCMRNLRHLIERVQLEKSWSNTDIRGFELNNKTLGIIGYGRLGKMVAKYAKCFGMTVYAYDIDESQYDDAVTGIDLDGLLAMSDVISINAKLNETSVDMIDSTAVAKMKDGVVIVNTARGGIIVSEAVLNGLESGKIATLGLDVCNYEFNDVRLPKDILVERSFKDRRIIITPHAGGSTLDAHGKVFGKISELIKEHLLGLREL